MTVEDHPNSAALAELDARRPIWTSTDWTAWQRRRAVAGQLLVAASCGLLAWSLTALGTEPLAATTFGPIAMTLLCLGLGLLTAAYWYRYSHAANCVGQRVSQLQALVGLTTLLVAASLVMVGVQVIGAVLVAWLGFPLWQGFSPYGYAIPAALGFVVFAGSLGAASGFTWRPTRAPDTPGASLTVSPRRVRLLLRWLVMLVSSRCGILIMIPAMTLFTGYLALLAGQRGAMFPIPTVSRVLTVIALCFVLTTLSEVLLWVTSRRSPAVH